MSYETIVRSHSEPPVPRTKKFDLKVGDRIVFDDRDYFNHATRTFAVVTKIYPYIFLVEVVAGDRTQHSFTKSQYLCGQVKRIE